MKKRLMALLQALILLCGIVMNVSAETEQTGRRVFTDDCGREVRIPDEITVIVPSGPLSQIVLYAIAPEMFVGLADRFGSAAKGFIPESFFELPCFGQLYGSASLNVEALAAAGPQLVIDVGEAGRSVAEDMDELEALTGIPSVHIEASLASMPEAFRKLGSLLKKEEKGEALAKFCEKVYARTLSVMDRVGDDKVRALYILGDKGLNVLAKGSYHAELIDLITDNLAITDTPAGKGSGNEVSLEQIALWDPDFILFSPDSIFGTVRERAVWRELTAVKSGNYAEVPAGPHNWMGTPPAVQRYLGMIWLTALLYPEYCDYDVKADILEYYELFYGCALTDEQYSALTARAFLAG